LEQRDLLSVWPAPGARGAEHAAPLAEPAPLLNDCFLPPQTARAAARAGAEPSPPPLGERPYSTTTGDTSGDTSEYMLGNVLLSVVLLESDGSIDPDTENWTQTQKDLVRAEIQEGADWWVSTLQRYFPNGKNHLTFQIDWTYLDSPAATGYEPIAGWSLDEDLWIDDFLDAVSYNTPASYFSDVSQWNDDQRVQNNCDWAYTVFVVNSYADADGCFADDYFAYGYAGGPFCVLTYDNDGWGIDEMGSTLAHETGHIFYAMDEYAGTKSYSDHRGYYDTPNHNALDNRPPALPPPDLCIMGEDSDLAYAAHEACQYTREMVGWRDTDGDGIMDVLDVPLVLAGTARYNATTRSLDFTGASSVDTLPNLNPSGNGDDLTTNTVDALLYSVDGGPWTYANFYWAYSTNVAGSVPLATPVNHTVRFHTLSAPGGPTSNELVYRSPTAQANGPYMIVEGAGVTLDAGGSLDPDAGDRIVQYGWDLNGDGVPDVTSATPAVFVPWATLRAYGIDNGPPAPASRAYTVALRTTDTTGLVSAAATANIQVRDTSPTPAVSGLPDSVEGTPYTLNLSVTDPGNDPVQSWTIDWGDGNVETVPGNPSSVPHTYLQGGARYTISASVTNQDGTFPAATPLSVYVRAHPVAAAGGPYAIQEGDSATLDGGASRDPDAGDRVVKYEWDLDRDGAYDISTLNSTTLVSWATLRNYGINNGPRAPASTSYVVALRVTDTTGLASTPATTSIDVQDTPPVPTISGLPNCVENQSYPLGLSVTDPGNDPVQSWTVNWGDGNVETVQGNPSPVPHTYLQGGASYTISASVTNPDGTFPAATPLSVYVQAHPVAAAGGPYAIKEGDNVTLDGGASRDPDAGDRIVKFEWDLDRDGDYDVSTANSTALVAWDTLRAAGIDNGPAAPGNSSYTVALRVTDSTGLVSTPATASINVQDTPPTPTISGPPDSVENQPYTLVLNVADPGNDPVQSWTINWGDGNVQTVAGNPTSVQHTFARVAQSCTISASITNPDGTFAAAALPVYVRAHPTAAPGGPYGIEEGKDVTLDGGASHDPDAGDGIVKYEWDLNADGVYDVTATTPAAPVTWTTLRAAGIDDGPAAPPYSSYVVLLRVTDSTGLVSAPATTSIQVRDAPPSLALKGADSAEEGTVYTLTLESEDYGKDALTTWSIDWRDGTPQETVSAAAGVLDPATGKWKTSTTATHRYKDGLNVYSIQAGAKDEDVGNGEYGAVPLTVTVLDVAPKILLSGAAGVNEGSAYSLTLGAVTDPGQDAITSYSVDWGDGSVEDFTVQANGAPTGRILTHTYLDGPSGYMVRASLVDEDGIHPRAEVAPVAVSVRDVAPTIDLSGAASVNEGSLYALVLGTVHDPGRDTISLYAIDWGDGQSEEFKADDIRNDPAVTHVYSDGTRAYTVSVSLTDEDGAHARAEANPFTVNVRDVPPTVAISGPTRPLKEGVLYTLQMSATDPGPSDLIDLSWSIDWGDGSETEVVSGDIESVDHVFQRCGKAIVSATATNHDGDFATNKLAITVVDVPAVLNAVQGAKSAHCNSEVQLTADFSDIAPGDVHTATWNWGDGATTSGEVVESDGTGTVYGSHVFITGGTQKVTLTLTDATSRRKTIKVATVKVKVAELVADPVDPKKTALVVAGTPGNDKVLFSNVRTKPGAVEVAVNNRVVGVFKPTGHILIYGGPGDDTIIVGKNIKQKAWLYDGQGYNTLVGAIAKPLVLGGVGSQSALARRSSTLRGPGASNANDRALAAILADWDASVR
jgi:hypothetical protein